MGSVGLVQCQIVPCSGLYLFSMSVGAPQMSPVLNAVLICSSSPFFVCFGFRCLQITSVSNLHPDTRGQTWPLI